MILGSWTAAVGVAMAVVAWALVLGMAHRGRSALPFVLAGAGGLALLTWGWHVDDAGIVYAYAKAIAGGRGLSPGIGAAPVEGFTDPLWVGLLAGAARVGVAPHFAAKVLQVGLALGTLYGVHRLALRAGATTLGADVGVAMAATSGAWAVWSTSGLEAALYGFLLVGVAAASGEGAPAGPRAAPAAGALAATFPVFAEARVRTVLRLALVGGLAAAAAWTRPEAGILAVVVAGLSVRVARAGGAEVGRWGAPLAAVGGALVGGAALVGLRWAWLGEILPNTAVAKLPGLSVWAALVGLAYAAWGAVLTGWLPASLGALPALRGPRRETALATLWIGGVACALAAAVGGDWMGHARLLAPAVPVFAAWAAPSLLAVTGRAGRPSRALGALAAALGVATLWHAYASPTLPIDHGLRRGELYFEVGRSMCGRASVATPDIGGVLYAWPQVEVHDLVGLIDAEVARHRRHPGYWAARFASRRPALVDLHGGWARRTDLPDEALRALDYRILCRRGPAPEAPTIWVDDRCGGAPSARAEHLVARWCAVGSGAPW